MERLPKVQRSRRYLPEAEARYAQAVDFAIVHHRWVFAVAWAVLTAIFTAGATTVGFDSAALPWIAGVIAVLVAGFVGGFGAIWRGRRAGWAGILGWLTVPALHLLAVAASDEGWAPTFFADVIGILLALVLAGVAIGAVVVPPVPEARWLRVVGSVTQGLSTREQ